MFRFPKFTLMATCLVALCAACSSDQGQVPWVSYDAEKEMEVTSIPVVSLAQYERDQKTDLNDCSIGIFNLFSPKGQKGALYTDLFTYSVLVSPYLKTGYVSTGEANAARSHWEIKKDDEIVFSATIDVAESIIRVSGSLSSVAKYAPDVSSSSYILGAKWAEETIIPGNEYVVSSYSFPVYASSEMAYFPLGILDAEFGVDLGISHIYDFEHLFQYEDPTQLTKSYRFGEETSFSPVKGISEFMESQPNKSMPQYLAELDRDVLYYVLDNHYGLKAQKGMATMKEVFDIFEDKLTSEKTIRRTDGLFDVFAYLDDDHTGLRSVSPWWGETSEQYHRGPTSNARTRVRKMLSSARSTHFTEEGIGINTIEYTSDKETALIRFDGFSYMANAFDSSGALRPDVWENDTFFYLAHQLREVEKISSVKNVVIDLSLNGGGVVGIMMKVLALLSDDNSAKAYFYDSCKGSVEENSLQIDSNLDGIYDLQDCFGDQFKFYILSSSTTFSAANALAFYADKLGCATPIGRTSGGGECIVGSSMLPSGHSFAFSSPSHIGWYDRDNGSFTGDENGVEPTHYIEYPDFYNISAIADALFPEVA